MLGRWLGRRSMQGRGAQAVRDGARFGLSEQDVTRTCQIKRATGLLGMLNMIATASVAAVTALLAMEGNQSARFAPLSRFLP